MADDDQEISQKCKKLSIGSVSPKVGDPWISLSFFRERTLVSALKRGRFKMRFSKTCLLIDTVTLDGMPGYVVNRFIDAAKGICEARVAVHPYSKKLENHANLLNYQDADILRCTHHKKDVQKGVIPGNFDLKMIKMAQDLPEFDHFVRIEYDVISTEEDWALTLQDLLEATEGIDFASSFLAKYVPDDPWMWWKTLVWPQGDWRDQSVVLPMRCFCPVTSYSRSFIDLYQTYLANGLAGHAEVTLSTVANYEKLKVMDLAHPHLSFTRYPQFTFDQPADLEKFIPRFIHPVKTYENFVTLKDKIQSLQKSL